MESNIKNDKTQVSQNYRVNNFDTNGDCWARGQKFEKMLFYMFTVRGYQVADSTRDDDIYLHADMWLTHYDEEYGMRLLSIDAKALKRIKRSDANTNDQYAWVEWNNVTGKDGWLLNGADLIAFERAETVIIVNRKQLLEWCKAKVSCKYVSSSSDALYNKYSRKGRNDIISLIDLDDIDFGYVWNKRLRLEDVLDQIAIALSELSTKDGQELIERLYRECRAHHE